MKKQWIIIKVFFALTVFTNLYASGNAPVQRIDVINLLGTGGSTPTSVTISFDNGGLRPCFSTTLPYQGAITVWVGIGQVCVTPVTSISTVPIAGTQGAIYDTPLSPTAINGTRYSTQLTINQNTAPVFNPGNGSLLSTGTIQTIVLTN